MHKFIFTIILINSFTLHCAQQLIKKEPENLSIFDIFEKKQKERTSKFVFTAEKTAKELIVKLITISQLQCFIIQKAFAKMGSTNDITINDYIRDNNTTLFNFKFELNQYNEIISEIENTDIIVDKPEDFEEIPSEYTYFKISERLWTFYYNEIKKLFDEKIITCLKHQPTVDEILKFRKRYIDAYLSHLVNLKNENPKKPMET